MALKDRTFATLAGQLAGPHGLFGRVVARRLNRINAASLQAAVGLLDPRPGSTVADVGFGGGFGLELLAERVGSTGVVHGIDPMQDMVRRAGRRWSALVADGRLVLTVGGMEDPPLERDALDGLITCNTIYFVPDLGAGLAGLARVVRPGGTVVIGMADPGYFTTRPFADHGFHIREIDEVATALQTAGFGAPRLHPVDIDRTTFHLLRTERVA
jgi:ubiquinone/menaquinone biosynthesis C-methylase UbiE